MNKFVIVIPFYNAEKYIEKCLMSAFTQRYSDYKVVIVNDASTDNSDKVISDLIQTFTITCEYEYIVNENRMGAMYNQQWAVFNHCDPDDIVVQLDGDDWLVNKKVLTFIDSFYEDNDCWMMYGQAKYLSGREGNAKEYESELEFNKKRNPGARFYVSHIRTFKAFTFHEILNQDPDLSCFKEEDGTWYSMTCDVAMMYPIMEICGYDKIKYNEKVLYIYNDSNPIQDFRLDLRHQERIHRDILQKKPFKQLDR